MSQVIIIIGLPGSGKTTLSNTFIDYLLFDDFISTFYDGKVIAALKSGNKVCLNDPRLCIYDIFIKYMDIIEKYVDKQNIQLILFENNPTTCLSNVKHRNDGRKGIELCIIQYSELYDHNNYSAYKNAIITL